MGLRSQKIAWNPQAEAVLFPALRGDLAGIRDEVQDGAASLYRFDHNRGSTWVVLRGEGSELVVVAMAGAGLHNVAAAIISSARRSGFASLRCHTDRAGMERMLRRYGAERREIVIGLEF